MTKWIKIHYVCIYVYLFFLLSFHFNVHENSSKETKCKPIRLQLDVNTYLCIRTEAFSMWKHIIIENMLGCACFFFYKCTRQRIICLLFLSVRLFLHDIFSVAFFLPPRSSAPLLHSFYRLYFVRGNRSFMLNINYRLNIACCTIME